LATLVIGAPLLAQTLASWGWGWLADRTGTRRAPLVLAMAVQAPLFLAFPVLNAPELFGVRLVQSALFGSVVLATTQATEDPTASSAVRLGRLQLASSGGMLSGIAVAFPLLIRSGFRLDTIGGWELSALLAGLTGLSALVFAAAGELRPAAPAPRRAPSSLGSNPGIFRLAAATTAVSTIRYIPVTAIPVYLADRLGAAGFFGVSMSPTAQLALWLAVSSAANLFVSPISGRLAESTGSRRWSMFGFSLVYAVIWTALFLDPSYSVTFAVWILPVSIFLVVATVREAAGLSRADQRGRAVGLLTAAFNLGGLLGGAVAGSLLASGTNLSDVFLVAAFGGFGAALLFLPRLIRLPPPVETVRTTGS
jgi:MFS family permease